MAGKLKEKINTAWSNAKEVVASRNYSVNKDDFNFNLYKDLERAHDNFNERKNNLYSYCNILFDKRNFVKGADVYDEPGIRYFKIFFYFNNATDPTSEGVNSNLLGLDQNTDANTAYNFLLKNGEYERASYLKRFIYLLSDISANTPWYFQSIEKIDEGLSHGYSDEKFEIDAARKSIEIKCLEDSADGRLTTLLSLYRAACWSQKQQRAIIPANLRKFDMGIYFFSAPTRGFTHNKGKNNEYNVDNTEFKNGFKTTGSNYIEYHNCEIDPDSYKTCYTGLDNTKGFFTTPTITISYDQCYTSTNYNELIQIGDFINIDYFMTSTFDDYIDDGNWNYSESIPEYKIDDSKSPISNIDYSRTINSKIFNGGSNYAPPKYDEINGKYILDKNYDYKYRNKGLVNNLISTGLGYVKQEVGDLIKKVYLGNVNKLSIADIADTARKAAKGDVIGAIASTKTYTKKEYNGPEAKEDLGNVIDKDFISKRKEEYLRKSIEINQKNASRKEIVRNL